MRRKAFTDDELRRVANEARVLVARGERVHWTALIARFGKSAGTFANHYRGRFTDLAPDVFWQPDGIVQVDSVISEKMRYASFLAHQGDVERAREVASEARALRVGERPAGQHTLEDLTEETSS